MAKSGIRTITVTPTVDTNIYASGDRCGSLMTLSDVVNADGDGIILESILILSKVVIATPAFYVLFFDDVPTIASADNAAIDISDAEMASKCIGMVSVGTSKAMASGCLLENVNVQRVLDCKAASRTLYALLVVEATPTFTSTTDLTVRFKFRELGA